jgi:type I restriction enzyme S subunit
MRIPGDWEIKRLIEIADIKGGKRLPKGYSLQDEYNGHPYITVSDMYEGGISDKNVKYVPIEVVDQIKRYRIRKGDLFISVAGTLGIVGKVPAKFHNANLTENADMITNIKIDKEYLFQVLISPIVQKEIEKVKTTSAQPKLALERIRNFTIPVPKHEKEMKKIADILSTWDKAIQLKEKLIEQKKVQKKGLMQRLLTGKIRWNDGKKFTKYEIQKRLKKISQGEIPEGYKFEKGYIIPYDWAILKISSILKIKHGKDQKSVEKSDGRYPILATSGQIGRTDQYLYNKPSVLIGRKGTIDRPQYIESPFWTVDTLFYSEIKENFVPKWVYYYFCTIPWKKYNEASGVPSLSASTIENIKIVVPPKLEQVKIAEILTAVDNEIELLEQELEALKQQKKGLMQLLLTGKVRVKC